MNRRTALAHAAVAVRAKLERVPEGSRPTVGRSWEALLSRTEKMPAREAITTVEAWRGEWERRLDREGGA